MGKINSLKIALNAQDDDDDDDDNNNNNNNNNNSNFYWPTNKLHLRY